MKPYFRFLRSPRGKFRWYLMYVDTHGNLYDSGWDFNSLAEAVSKHNERGTE